MLVEGMANPPAVAGGGSVLAADEETEPLARLSRAMQRGTATHVEAKAEAGEDQPCLSIVAQAESETAPPLFCG